MNFNEKQEALSDLSDAYADCGLCKLCQPTGRTRRNVAFGRGNPDAKILIVVEAPDDPGDRTADPCAAEAGKLVDAFLNGVHATRDDVYVTSVVSCYPTKEDNPYEYRPPSADEIEACSDRLQKVVEIVDPNLILLFGETALKALTKDKRKINALAKDHTIPAVKAYTKGQCATVERPALATFSIYDLLRRPEVRSGSDRHLAYLAVLKAFQVSDMFEHLYTGTPVPDRTLEPD
jgi:uracil-DNA glycosylase family 4